MLVIHQEILRCSSCFFSVQTSLMFSIIGLNILHTTVHCKGLVQSINTMIILSFLILCKILRVTINVSIIMIRIPNTIDQNRFSFVGTKAINTDVGKWLSSYRLCPFSEKDYRIKRPTLYNSLILLDYGDFYWSHLSVLKAASGNPSALKISGNEVLSKQNRTATGVLTCFDESKIVFPSIIAVA